MESQQSTATPEKPDEVLKVWDVESSHKYENNQHTSQVKMTLIGQNLAHLAHKYENNQHTSQVKMTHWLQLSTPGSQLHLAG